ncbi:hypothetical protein HPB51_017627 [Rhipicephalus microplus]|uniref:CCHC-type domain-containing protein n=1 Tax=Rhipicephalus microplus TaxID=6941 RepID=A0A9J6EHK5_RHIMP|nr:hypothetical protein HPB51_017627 [Rhipicephalus microplus]
MVGPNLQQNIIVVSTPIEARADKYQRTTHITVGKDKHETSAYEAAPDYTSKGAIGRISLEDSPRDITASVVTPKNPTALAAKRLSNTKAVIVLFEGFRVPTYVHYGGALLRCTLYQKQVATLYHCGRLGHRADVCPNPQDRICRGCGAPSPPPPPPLDHQCTPTCQLCGSDHQTADRICRARYKTFYIVTRSRWERQQVSPKPRASSYDANKQDTLLPPPQRGRDRPESRTQQGLDPGHGAEHQYHTN